MAGISIALGKCFIKDRSVFLKSTHLQLADLLHATYTTFFLIYRNSHRQYSTTKSSSSSSQSTSILCRLFGFFFWYILWKFVAHPATNFEDILLLKYFAYARPAPPATRRRRNDTHSLYKTMMGCCI